MSWVFNNKAVRKAAYSFAVVGLATAGLWFGAQTNTTEANTNNLTLASAPAATFAPDAGTLGAIPDGPGTPTLCGSDGAPRNVTFTVSGLSGAPTNVVASMTFGGPVHTFAGDVKAILIAPNGTSHSLFGRPLATTSAACGDASDLAGPYTFSDAAAAPPSGGWWQAATAETTSTAPIASGTYRTTNSGGAGATNPMPPTNMNAAFAGVTNPNGTWTLRLLDGGGGDTGAVSAATLTIDAGTPGPSVTPQNVVDFDGNGRTDFTTVRNTGGGASGQVTWFINYNAGAGSVAYAWGLASDFFVSGDYDGDNKSDVVVWRAGAAGTAAFYILQSATSTVRIDTFGQTGDDPTVVGDYDGDGKDDVAVYRGGASAGQQSTWFFRGSSANPGGNITYIPWGQNGDFPAPGDYDGNGRADYVVQRNAGGGQAAFWTLLSTGATSVRIHGTPTDVIVPGDYDGDGKTDIATIRGSGGSINWYYQSSASSFATISGTWGASATDFPTQGDYDGDGKTDFAVWRPSATAGASAFYYYRSGGGGAGIAAWGANGDYPVANFNSH